MEPLMPEVEMLLCARVRSRATRRHRVLRAAPVLVGAVLALAVFGVALTLHTSNRTGQGAAARHAASAPPGVWIGSPDGVTPPSQLGPGQYWYVRTLVDEPTAVSLGRGPRSPVVQAHQEFVIERWIGRHGPASRSVQTPVGPIEFYTAAARARWRAAGAPTAIEQTTAQPSYSFPVNTGFGRYPDLSYTYQQVQRLPTQPTRLLAAITARLHSPRILDRIPARFRATITSRQLPLIIAALLEAPVPRPVHAALIAAAQRIAGKRAHPGPDPIGRAGTVLPLGASRVTVVIDDSTGALLANTSFGTLSAYIAAGVVDSPTAVPTGIPPVRPRTS